MAERGTAGRKHSGLIFSSKGWIGPYRTKAQFKPKGKKHTERVCKSNPRLGHSASRTRLGKPLREDKPAACYGLEPGPTKFSTTRTRTKSNEGSFFLPIEQTPNT
jgi:hypothetical protein